MTPFKSHRGVIATLDRANVDTDQIIPKQFLKSIARTGFGEHLFHDWRLDKNFELNASRFAGATILVTRANFGCGSSREHAVWAIQQAGFSAVIAPTFADIFKNNGVKNGLLTVELKSEEVEEIFHMVGRYPGLDATVDLPHQRVVLHVAEELAFHFEIEPAVKEHLIHGVDEIGLTLQHEAAIRAFETRYDPQMP